MAVEADIGKMDVVPTQKCSPYSLSLSCRCHLIYSSSRLSRRLGWCDSIPASLCQSEDRGKLHERKWAHYSVYFMSGHWRPLIILWCDLVTVWFAHALCLLASDSHTARARRMSNLHRSCGRGYWNITCLSPNHKQCQAAGAALAAFGWPFGIWPC